jgi:hypothetical protein
MTTDHYGVIVIGVIAVRRFIWRAGRKPRQQGAGQRPALGVGGHRHLAELPDHAEHPRPLLRLLRPSRQNDQRKRSAWAPFLYRRERLVNQGHYRQRVRADWPAAE